MAATASINQCRLLDSQSSDKVGRDRTDSRKISASRIITSASTSLRTAQLASRVLRGTTVKIITTTTKSRNATICCRASQDDYGNCSSVEEAVTAIMKDTLQHCLGEENDTMREKVLNQMGKGLAALVRISAAVAAASPAPPPISIPAMSTIAEDDLEQVRRMLKLTSLPFHSSFDHELTELMLILQTGYGHDRNLTANELSQICKRLGSDMVQCLGPLFMCFHELPLWAKCNAFMLPADMAGRVAFNLLAGPNTR
ncbi:uncharacterized protein [Physcomitrium patens]